jgi:hypothetical protein
VVTQKVVDACKKKWLQQEQQNTESQDSVFFAFGTGSKRDATIQKQNSSKIMVGVELPCARNGRTIFKPFMIGRCQTAMPTIYPSTASIMMGTMNLQIAGGQRQNNKQTTGDYRKGV